MEKIRVGLVSLGCPKNLCDSESMLALIKGAGFEIVGDAADADVIVINTCAFIEEAQKEAIDTILEMAEYKKSGSARGLVVSGCLCELFETEIREQFPEVDAFLGVGSGDMIVNAVKAAFAGEQYDSFEDKNDKVAVSKERVLTNPGHYAYIKIADGCDNTCSYCLIPEIRGIYRSRPVEEIVEEAKMLAERGVKEIILVAQDVTKYGIDLYNEYKIRDLLPLLNEIDGIKRIRLQYMYPERVHGDLLKIIRGCDKVVHYFDIPIQHSETRILKKMSRLGNPYRLEILFDNIRRILPDAVIRTTVITGFPSETDEEFEALMQFVKKIKFDRLGAFPFSPMEGTDAYHMRAQIPDEVKTARTEALMEAQAAISKEKLSKRIGTTEEVMTDGFDDEMNLYYGRTYAESPDIDGCVYFGSLSELKPGDIVNVLILDADEHDLYGRDADNAPDESGK
ncbi:MAG: 30S ribosomal protein S12 methylthiotransferase RimO [Clostridia bacterium]|nr:30S ribosomal protein S12 methylthiotransferase RimO [Clostridia bacterium]